MFFFKHFNAKLIRFNKERIKFYLFGGDSRTLIRSRDVNTEERGPQAPHHHSTDFTIVASSATNQLQSSVSLRSSSYSSTTREFHSHFTPTLVTKTNNESEGASVVQENHGGVSYKNIFFRELNFEFEVASLAKRFC